MLTTQVKVLNYLQIDTNAFIDAGFSDWEASVSAWIEKFTNKNFEPDTETRYFDGSGKRTLFLDQEDDLISVTSLKILDTNGDVVSSLTEGQDNDYMLYPLNTTPKFEIRLSTSSSVGAFYSGNKKIEITGVWGNSSAVPADVELASTMMLSQIIKQGIDGGVVSGTRLGDYSVNYVTGGAGLDDIANNSGAISILNNYRDFTI